MHCVIFLFCLVVGINFLPIILPFIFQVSFLGFCGTMGAEYMDYIVADNTVIPQHSRVFYQEKVYNVSCCIILTSCMEFVGCVLHMVSLGAPDYYL